MAKMQEQSIAEVGEERQGEKAKQYSNDEALHVQIILARDGVAHGSGNSFQCERGLRDQTRSVRWHDDYEDESETGFDDLRARR